MNVSDHGLGCFSDEIVESYVRGELSKVRARELESHAVQCPRCTATLEQFREDADLAKQICDAEQAFSISDRVRVQSAASDLLKSRCPRMGK